MMNDDLSSSARRLLGAFDALRPWHSLQPPIGMTLEQAYVLQGEVARLRVERGERVIGYKIGCASRAIQEQLGIGEPIFGRVFDTGCHPFGSRLRQDQFAGLAIEGELAIRLTRDVPGGTLSDEEAVGAIGAVFPVIELHHYVLPEQGNALAALIASGGMHAGLVLAERETACSGTMPEVENLVVHINDRQVGSTRQPWALGGPAGALRWLAARLAESDLPLKSGQIILTASALPLYRVEPGSRVVAEARPIGMSSATFE